MFVVVGAATAVGALLAPWLAVLYGLVGLVGWLVASTRARLVTFVVVASSLSAGGSWFAYEAVDQLFEKDDFRALSRDGAWMAYLRADQGFPGRWRITGVGRLRVADGRLWQSEGVDAMPRDIDADGRALFAGSAIGGSPKRVFVVDGEGTRRLEALDGCFDARWLPGGRIVAVLPGALRVHDGRAGVLQEWRLPPMVESFSWPALRASPDGQWAAVVGPLSPQQYRLVVVELASGRQVIDVDLAEWPPTAMAFDTAGARFAVVRREPFNTRSRIQMYELPEGTRTTIEPDIVEGAIESMAFDAHGRLGLELGEHVGVFDLSGRRLARAALTSWGPEGVWTAEGALRLNTSDGLVDWRPGHEAGQVVRPVPTLVYTPWERELLRGVLVLYFALVVLGCGLRVRPGSGIEGRVGPWLRAAGAVVLVAAATASASPWLTVEALDRPRYEWLALVTLTAAYVHAGLARWLLVDRAHLRRWAVGVAALCLVGGAVAWDMRLF